MAELRNRVGTGHGQGFVTTHGLLDVARSGTFRPSVPQALCAVSRYGADWVTAMALNGRQERPGKSARLLNQELDDAR